MLKILLGLKSFSGSNPLLGPRVQSSKYFVYSLRLNTWSRLDLKPEKDF
jgi:hypothetical protein